MIIAVPKETAPGEKRVALVPETVGRLVKGGHAVLVEPGAGDGSLIADAEFKEKGAEIASGLLGRADVVLKVRAPTDAEIAGMREGTAVVSFVWPLQNAALVRRLAGRRLSAFSMDMMPRISRAQSMDALSSMSTIAGYLAAVRAADLLPRFFPLLMTAAGTIPPGKVFVIGAGVAGLQAIATARRLGAVVEAYDQRPVVKEQIESLGGKFVVLPLEVKEGQDAGGYAKAQSDEFYNRQRQLLADKIATVDVVITTALIPGKKAPLLVTADAVRRMRSGSVVIDIAAEQGGNCELTEPGQTVVKHGVTIVGMTEIPSMMAPHASMMYSRNIATFFQYVAKAGKLNFDRADEIVKGTLITHEGAVVHDAVKGLLEKAGAPA